MPIPQSCVSGDPTFERDLSMLLDGELDASRAQSVRRHLEGCASCSQVLSAFERVDRSLRGAVLPMVPQDLVDKIGDAIEPEFTMRGSQPPRTSPVGRWRWAGAALALAASVATYLAVIDPVVPFEHVSEEELAVALEFDTIRDLDVIANLDLVERLVAIGAGAG